MRIGVILFVLTGLSFSAGAQSEPFIARLCYVFSRPSPESKIVCEGKKGDPIAELDGAANSFSYVVLKSGCRGYVSDICIFGSEGRDSGKMNAEPKKRKRRRKRPQVRQSVPLPLDERALIPGVAAHFHYGGFLGGVAYSNDNSSGSSFGGGVESSITFSRLFRCSLMVSYESLRLSREVDSSGIISSTTENFSQKVTYVGIGFLGSLHWSRFLPGSVYSPLEGWLDLGGEYFLPLSAVQSDTVMGEVAITDPDKQLMLVTGVSGLYRLTPRFGLELRAHAYYNLAARQGSSLLGLRAVFAVRQSL